MAGLFAIGFIRVTTVESIFLKEYNYFIKIVIIKFYIKRLRNWINGELK